MSASPVEVVRGASVEDAAGIATVHVAAWRVAYRGVVPEEVLATLSVEQRERGWRRTLADGAVPTLVAESGGRVVGFCTLACPARDDDAGERTAEIAAIYVDPERWRRGIGTRLARAALDRLRGRDSVTLWVFAANAAAIAFYERLGFAPDGAERDDDFGQRAIRMRSA